MNADVKEEKERIEAIQNLTAAIFEQIGDSIAHVLQKSLSEKDFSIIRKFVSIVSFLGDCHNGTDDFSAIILTCENVGKKPGSIVSMSGLNISEDEAECVVQAMSEGIAMSKTRLDPSMMN